MSAGVTFIYDPNSVIRSNLFYCDSGLSGWDDKYFYNPNGLGEVSKLTANQLSYASDWIAYDYLISKNISFSFIPTTIAGQVRNRTDFSGNFSSNDSQQWSYGSIKRFIDFRADATSSTTTFEIYSGIGNFLIDESPTFVYANDDKITGSLNDDIIFGFGGSDTLAGRDGNDRLYGDGFSQLQSYSIPNDWKGRYFKDGNDLLIGGLGNDYLDGGIGVDVAKYGSNLSSYKINYTSPNELSVSFSQYQSIKPLDEGLDSLVNIERLEFADVSIALDLAGNAGAVAKILGAVFGKSTVNNRVYVGIGLDYLDKGLTYEALATLALGVANLTMKDQIVTALWTNIIGTVPSASDKAPFIKLLEDGLTPGSLTIMAAETSFNAININLVGLAQTGIEYLPFG